MKQAIEERGDRGGVPQQLALIVDRTFLRQQRGRALVATHDDFQEISMTSTGTLTDSGREAESNGTSLFAGLTQRRLECTTFHICPRRQQRRIRKCRTPFFSNAQRPTPGCQQAFDLVSSHAA
jgi:hypothetical protein